MLYDLTYVWNLEKKQQQTHRTSRSVIARGGMVGEKGEGDQKVQISFLRWMSSGELMYRMVTIVHNTVLYIWKLLREWILKILMTYTRTHKGNCVCVCVCV